MYRQGLGDSFLLTFPRPERDAHVLIDCGVLTGTPDAEARMQRIARNIVDTTGGLDALVVTHEHWDHISGFLQAEAIFDELRVKEVWLAWTEDPRDELANDLRNRKTRAVDALTAVTNELRRLDQPAASRTADRLAALLEFQGGLEMLGVQGRKTTAKAMAWVKDREGKGARIRYFKPGATADITGVDGLRAYVLGPPRDLAALRRSDPSTKHSEVYELSGDGGIDLGFLSAVEALGGGAAAVQPFAEWFRVGEKDAAGDAFFKQHYSDGPEWQRVDHDWMEAAGRLALQLDSDTNNTCLALAFELGPNGRVLLFPGDAQVGNWLSWATPEWRAAGGADAPAIKARDLLARTVLYKVGHHGSHNATLREQGLELMTSAELAAMIPISRSMAEKMEWNMPFPSLLRRLKEKTAGRILDRDEGVSARVPGALSDLQWDDFVRRTDVKEDWIDYLVPV